MKRKKKRLFSQKKGCSALSVVHKGKHFCSALCFVVFFFWVFSFSKNLSWSRDGRKETHIVTSTFEVFKDMLTGFPLNQLGTIKIYQYKLQDLQLKASPGKLDHLESELNKKLPSISQKNNRKAERKIFHAERRFRAIKFCFFEPRKANLCRKRGIWSM